MYRNMSFIEDAFTNTQIAFHRYWVNAWAEGLAYCLDCGMEYRDSQKVMIDGIENCPHCSSDYGKRYYFCKEHGSRDDDCER